MVMVMSPVIKDCDNISCLSVNQDSHDNCSVGLRITKEILEICIIQCLLWDTTEQINTHKSAVHKQTHTRWNASGICHNRPPLMEWCLINRGLPARPWRYHSPLLQSRGDSSAFINKPVSLPIAHTRETSWCIYIKAKHNISITEYNIIAIVRVGVGFTRRYTCRHQSRE